jgi:uncharacterized membrane protein YgdD (TMEM256/DUF423 family)
MKKKVVSIAVLFIFISIILGAFGAHGLKEIVSDKMLITFDKGVKYIMYSGLGLFILSLNDSKFTFDLKWSYRLIIIGTLMFSVNIFIFTFSEHLIGLRNFVHLVPVGGLLMIIGWGILFLKLISKKG